MLSTNPLPLHQGKGKRRKRERDEINSKTDLLIMLTIVVVLKEIKQNIQKSYRVSWSWVPLVFASHQ